LARIMGKLLDKVMGRGKNKEAEEFKRNMALTTAMPSQEDYTKWLGPNVYSIIDDKIVALLVDEDMEFMLPLLSHLNRMTQLNKDDVKMARYDLEASFLMFEALRDEGDYNAKRAMLTENLQFFANFILTDSFEGFKAKIMAYQMKISRFEFEDKKKGRL